MSPDTRQTRLDFERPFAERMLVMRLRLQALTPAATGLSAPRLENVRQCLLAVYAHAGACPERYAQADPAALQATAELSRSALSRARTDAVGLGLMRPERSRVRAGQKRPPDRLWIDHPAIDRLVDACRDQVGSGGNRWDQVGSHRGNPQTLFPKKTPTPHGAPHADPAARSGERGGGGCLQAMAAALRAAGLSTADSTAEAFAARGGTPQDLQRLLAVYASGRDPAPPAWGAGALRLRLQRWTPAADPSADWPPADPQHAAAVERLERDYRRAKEDRRLREQQAERERAQAERAANRAAWAEGPSALDQFRALTRQR